MQTIEKKKGNSDGNLIFIQLFTFKCMDTIITIIHKECSYFK